MITDINGDILAKAYNLVESKQDPTAHAEILAIKKATIILKNKYLIGCSLYVTLEPCSHYGLTPPCTNIIKNKKQAVNQKVEPTDDEMKSSFGTKWHDGL